MFGIKKLVELALDEIEHAKYLPNYMPLSKIPYNLRNCVIAVEDKNFYSHRGLSLRAIARAIVRSIFNRRIQGG